MQEDIDRWDKKYARADVQRDFAPDPVLVERANLLGSGRALDLACGVGGNAIFLAEHGFDVCGIDCSKVGLSIARAEAARRRLNIEFVAADLDEIVLETESFDVIVVVKYLNRTLFSSIASAVRGGGHLYYRTFNRTFLDRNSTFPADYVLAPMELSDVFTSFETIATNERPEPIEPLSFWLGRKPV